MNNKILQISRAVFYFSLGIIVHDIAVINGFHIPGLHAYYFALPIAIVALVLWRFEVFFEDPRAKGF